MSENYDSSDSDDCYGNIAQKLQNIKSTYELDSIKSVNILNENKESKSNSNVSGSALKPSDNVVAEETISLNDSEEIDLDLIIAQNSKQINKRSTRKKIVNSSPTIVTNSRRGRRKPNAPEVLPPTNGRRRTRASELAAMTNNCGTERTNIVELSPINNCGKRSRRSTKTIQNSPRGTHQRGGRTARGKNRVQYIIDSLPIYSVGNTDEYPDQLENCELFKQKTGDIIVLEEEPVVDIEELSVKVYWQSVEIVKFMLRKYQKLTTVFEYFSTKENVHRDKLFFMYNDKIITIDDTPDSIDYNIGKFIEGGILNQNVNQLIKRSRKVNKQNGINIKFQCMTLKKPFEIFMEIDEAMHLAMVKFSEHIEVEFKKLKFYFDGDQITGKITPKELELEGGECIDVKIAS